MNKMFSPIGSAHDGRDGVPSPSALISVGGGTPTLPAGGVAFGRDGVPSPSARVSVGGGTPTLPVRKRINHRGPLSIDIADAWYFITICATERVKCGRDGALLPIAADILECARQYHVRGKWRLALFLVMPDHLHFIVHVPDRVDVSVGDETPTLPAACAVGGGTPTLPAHGVAFGRDGVPPPSAHDVIAVPSNLSHVIRHWKHYVAHRLGISFQKDFWDTRLRNEAHHTEVFRYICNNPVRKGLCQTAREWPYVIAFDRRTGEERIHR